MIPAKYETLKISSDVNNLRLVERLIEDVCDVYNVHGSREQCYTPRQ